VAALLGNPKYTGFMVYGRRRKIRGKIRNMPQSEWIWSARPSHPAIIDRDTWDEAQQVAAERGNTPDTDSPTRPGRAYVPRSRVFCKVCNRRMNGTTSIPRNADGYAYYRCPHNPRNPRHAAAYPDHPAVTVREEPLLDVLTGEFFAERVFGPDRAALLAAG
jgi:hypothetical protein